MSKITCLLVSGSQTKKLSFWIWEHSPGLCSSRIKIITGCRGHNRGSDGVDGNRSVSHSNRWFVTLFFSQLHSKNLTLTKTINTHRFCCKLSCHSGKHHSLCRSARSIGGEGYSVLDRPRVKAWVGVRPCLLGFYGTMYLGGLIPWCSLKQNTVSGLPLSIN